ncbi:hypothetical protein BGX29_010990 [Mortierella sp. GBA35]|nr:hypothetical protein BGX29_010990 [Mortierella sp. GBA35]
MSLTGSNIHSTKDSDSLRSSSNSSIGKTSLAAIDRLSTGKVEPSVSATSGNSFDAETIVSKTAAAAGSASQSLQSIIHKSSANSLAGSPFKASKTDPHIASASDDSTSVTIAAHAPVPSAFIGTVLEGHSVTPSDSATTTTATTAAETSIETPTSALPDQPTESTPTLTQTPTLTADVTPPTAIPDRIERVLTYSSDSLGGKRSSMGVFSTWWSGGSPASVNSTNPGPNSAHEKPYTQAHGHSMLNMATTTSSPTPTAVVTTSTETAASTTVHDSGSAAQSKLDTSDSMDWGPSGPETAILQKARGLGVADDANAMDVDGGQVQNAGLEISPTHAKDADDPTKSIDTTAKPSTVTAKPSTVAAKVSDAQANTSKKRWSIFGYGAKDDIEAGRTKLRKSGDVLIEPESRPASVAEALVLPTSSSTSTLVATITATPSAMTAANASTKTIPSSGSQSPPRTQVTNQIAESSDETGPVAPALVGTSQLSVVVPPGNAVASGKSDSVTNTTGTMSSSYNWLSIIPGYGNKTEDASRTKDDMVASHQVTDFEEGERKDINGNTISFGEEQPGRTFAQLAEAKNTKVSAEASKEDGKDSVKARQTFAQFKESENQESGVAKEAGKAMASLSKVILRKKNVVLPNYYEQYPDVWQSLIAPIELPLHRPSRGRSASIMKSAVNVISNLLFSSPSSPQVPTSPQMDSQQRGTSRIRKVAIIGVHGWFPVKLIRTVIGEPTGTSRKFCDEMHRALKDYLKIHNVELEPEDCTLIPLEGEGKVLNRVDILYKNLVKNEQWKNALHEADLVLVATHSQGTPTSTLLVARLIEEGMLRIAKDDPRMQRVGILAMAGISHGPFPFLKGNLIVRWFEAEAAQELFEFMDSETEIAKKYREALRIVLTSGVRFTCVASLEDQVVPLYSAVMTSIHHPSIVRAVYIDGATYQDDFLTNLISFSLRLRNSGVDDHGVLVHLSEVIAGSIYGEGHSTIYEEREVYLLAIRSLLEPPKSLTSEMARSEPILHPFQATQTLNPFYLPWGMRGVMDEIKSLGDEVLNEEMERLKKLYDEWSPVSKGMKEIKFRLEPVRSRL